MELLGNALGGTHVNAGLDRQHHAALQNARRAVLDELAAQRVLALADGADLGWLNVAAAIVNVHAQPVAGAGM